jgi:hypothetical protein
VPRGWELPKEYANIDERDCRAAQKIGGAEPCATSRDRTAIRRNSDLLTKVRERLSKDISSGPFSISLTDAMQEWLDLLKSSSLEKVLELLVDDSENARQLRQSTPFAGILTQEERRRIIEKHESAGV